MTRAVAASSTALQARRRASARARLWTRLAALAAVVVAVAIGLGFVFAGSPEKLASGTRIAGVDVGDRTPAEAQRLLERRSARLARVPVTFVSGGERFTVTPKALGVEVDWGAAVATAERQGSGFGFVRGYRRLELEFFPDDLVPPVRAYDAALTYELGLIAKAVNTPHR
ncbi:MAG: hypothetical protein ACJ74R_12860, partial [Gaiellaceae bacterium]